MADVLGGTINVSSLPSARSNSQKKCSESAEFTKLTRNGVLASGQLDNDQMGCC